MPLRGISVSSISSNNSSFFLPSNYCTSATRWNHWPQERAGHHGLFELFSSFSKVHLLNI